MTMGEDFRLLSAFARKTRGGVPATAILFQLAVVTALLLTQSFESIVEFIQFSLTISSFLTVLGVIVLRFTQPALPRPYKVWGYPITPLLFLAVSLFMMVNLVLERPAQSLAGVAIMLSGLLVYAVSARHGRGGNIPREFLSHACNPETGDRRRPLAGLLSADGSGAGDGPPRRRRPPKPPRPPSPPRRPTTWRASWPGWSRRRTRRSRLSPAIRPGSSTPSRWTRPGPGWRRRGSPRSGHGRRPT